VKDAAKDIEDAICARSPDNCQPKRERVAHVPYSGPPRQCPRCKGTGLCPTCGGKKACTTCRGKGQI
jgi:DnaJ-class molecular chaperone